MELHSIGRALLPVGIVIALLGGLLMLFGRVPFLSGLGKLPGDIHIEGKNFSIFIPLTSAILLSIMLTAVINIIIRLINRQ